MKEPGLETVVIIGNGMVSHRLCAELTSVDHRRPRKIVVLGEEPYPAYDRVNLTSYFDGKADLPLDPIEWYAERGIELHLGDPVISIDRAEKRVTTSTGRTVAYEKLVFATGSVPFIPPIPGTDLSRVFVYRTIKDVEAIQACLPGAKHGIVLGGGLLGLEAANVLARHNIEAHIIQNGNGLMSRQLNQDASAVLQRKVEALGIRVHLKVRTTAIEEAPGPRLSVRFGGGAAMRTDIVIIAAGIRPRDELARSVDLRVGIEGGILVDDHLCTNDPAIHAIGECAMHRGIVYGLVSPGYRMASVLARILAGHHGATFEGGDLSSRLKLLGVEVSTFGDFLGAGAQIAHKTKDSYRMLVFEGSELVGGTVIGAWEHTATLQLAIQEKRSFNLRDRKEFAKTGYARRLEIGGGVAAWPPTAVVCNCTNTTRGTLSDCINQGCKTVESLAEKTGASTVCGSCRPLLGELVGADPREVPYRPHGRFVLLTASIMAAIIVTLALSLKPFPEADTVQGWYYQFTQLWHAEVAKQITGFTMAGLSGLALLLSLRKRIRFLRFGNFGFWRAIHSVLGTLCLVTLVFHTGFRFGENLDRCLLFCFLSMNLAGAIVGFTIAMEQRFSGPKARFVRALVTRAHILFFWPYPVLLGFHIFKAYYF